MHCITIHTPMKPFLAILVFVTASAANADTKYFGIYVQGTKTGYSSEVVRPDHYEGHPAVRTDSQWINTMVIAGSTAKMIVNSTSWSSPDNRPIAETTEMKIGGRTIKIKAVFGPKTVEVDLDTGGTKSHKSIAIPEGPVFDDMIKVIHEKIPSPGQRFTYWSFESGSLAFQKVELDTIASSMFKTGAEEISAVLTEIKAEGATARVFTNAEGELVRKEFPLGMVLQSESKAVALAKPGKDEQPPDLVLINSLKSDKPIDDALHLSELKLRISGDDLSAIPSDPGQSVTKDGDAWVVDVHPTRLADSVSASIVQAEAGYEQWAQPSLYMPSDSQKLRELAGKIVRKSKDVVAASLAIKQYVNKMMKPDMGIGVARDASQILREKKGKCTDYAILTTTLMRAAGIPARVAVGLVTGDGTFYYHAWSEAWDGKRWIGIDSTIDDEQLSACHIKLAEGNVEEGLKISYPIDPAKVKIEVLVARH